MEQSLQRKHVMAVVGNGFQPFRSDGVVGRGPRARRFSGNERNQANGTTRAVPERAAFRTVRG